ncbi:MULTISPECIES: hypothetical protein [unclassified Burkholderia]|uniref:hypothetical protein n=1 Tax=unclassified Burkholderia TaxID=2613784 RepID=UPI000AF1DDC6|nr:MULTISPECIES: hypothetical protein [unclassified Burkholderia]
MRAENAARNSDSGFHEVAPSASDLTLARTPLSSSGTSYLELAELLAGLSGQWERTARACRISDRLCVVLLLAMCREGGRAREFICDDTNYGDPDEFDLLSDPPMADEVLIRLAKTLGMLKSFTFICDYGAIGSIGSRSRMRSRPIRNCVGSYAWTDRAPASQRRLVVHFCYVDFLVTINDPLNEEHDRCLEWCGNGLNSLASDLKLVSQWILEVKYERRGCLSRHTARPLARMKEAQLMERPTFVNRESKYHAYVFGSTTVRMGCIDPPMNDVASFSSANQCETSVACQRGGFVRCRFVG